MSRALRIEHLGRVEGHGGITVELEGDALAGVRFDVFEGLRLLEGLVRGRSFTDVSPIVSRICAICSAVHALTSIEATEAAFGVRPSAQTVALRDLLLRGENLASHALHLFLLAAPDYLGYPSAPAMAADYPDAVALGLRLKKLGNKMQELIGGRTIHPINAVPGGFSWLPTVAELVELEAALVEAQRDAEAAVGFVGTLPPARFAPGGLDLAALVPNAGYGYHGGDTVDFLTAAVRTSVPAASLTTQIVEQAVVHSHAKHSTFRERPFMVGALARIGLVGDRLSPAARAAAERLGLERLSSDPMDNNAAQAVELVEDVDASLAIVRRLLADGVAAERPLAVEPRAGVGVAVVEAPRGVLVHRYEYDAEGRIVHADVVTPTAFNAAHVEQSFRRVVESGRGEDDDELKLRLERVARAYDPCISCSVHLVRRRASS